MRIVITGGQGQLAADLAAVFGDEDIVILSRAQFDIAAPDVASRLAAYSPDMVLNTAAYHNVDLCESEPEQSFLVNAAAPQRLAAACKAMGALLVHYSTDYVFDGSQRTPYPEAAPVRPLSVYGCSKAAGEMAIRATTDDHLIVRTTGLYGTRGQSRSRGNFVETMLRLGASGQELRVVCDQVLTPSATYDVATITRDLMHRGVRGTVHATNAGECSWYEFARAIFELAELSVSLSPVAQAERPAPARRPSYSVLEHGALRAAGLPEPRNWRDALEEYLERRTKV